MAQEKTQPKTGMFDSPHGRALLLIVTGLLLFGGPYLVYILVNVVQFNYYLSMVSGLILFLIGGLLLWYVIKRKIIT